MIDHVELLLFEQTLLVPLANPITPGNEICTVVALVRTQDGATGIGYGWAIGKRRATMIAESTKWAAEFFVGQDERRTDALWENYLKILNFTGLSGLGVIGPSVLDIALWDLRAKRAELPLAKLLGGHKTAAPMYRNLISDDYTGTTDAGELADAVAAAVDEGHRAFKLRFGFLDVPSDVRRLESLLASVAGGTRFAVDVAQRWSAAEAVRGCDAVDDLGLFWLEDPVASWDLATHARLSERSATPICTGENAYLSREVQSLLNVAKPDVLMLDLQRCGGITGWLKSAALAEMRGVSLTPHTYPHVGIHLVAGTPAATVAEHITWWDELFGLIPVADGEASVPTPPGVGLDAVIDRLGDASWRIVAN